MADTAESRRDRYADLLRVCCMVVVVAGHWIGAVVVMQAGRAGTQGILEGARNLWPFTWVLQIIPLFFFIGGFANFTALASARRRGTGVRGFLRARALRLLAPTAVFGAAWVGLVLLLNATGLGGVAWRLAFLMVTPLWFLGVYLAVTAATPAMAALHRRFGWRVVLAMVATAGAVDALRLGAGVEPVKWVNLPVVWLLAHQLGFCYANGSLVRAGTRAHAAMAAGGLAALGALTGSGLYPKSMVGISGDRISNMNPPTICIVGVAFWLVGLVMLLRGPALRWLARSRPWTIVSTANHYAMMAFLWHLVALAMAAAILVPLGFGQAGADAWRERPVWLSASATMFAVLLSIYRRLELRTAAPPTPAIQ